MQMVAALDLKRDRIAERRKNLIGPRPHRHHDVARGDGAFQRRHPPPSAGLFERSCVADQISPALAAEQRRIGLGQAAGIGHESRRRKMDRAAEIAGQMRLARRNRRGVENLARDAILPGALEIPHRVRKRRLGAKQLDPAGPPQQLRHVGFRDQRLMLDQAALDQRQFGHRAVQCTLRRRGEEIAYQPRQEGRQIREMVPHLRRAKERVSQDLAEIPRKHVGKDRGAFDQSAIAVTGFLAGNARAGRSGPRSGRVSAGARRR